MMTIRSSLQPGFVARSVVFLTLPPNTKRGRGRNAKKDLFGIIEPIGHALQWAMMDREHAGKSKRK